MTNLAFVFPGQGSQSVGMMTAWESHQPTVDKVFAEASDALGYDLRALVVDGPEARLNQTEVTQPAMRCAGVASFRVVVEAGLPAASLMAGHSLGEYTALVCAGSLALADAARLVSRRGQLMQSAVAVGDGAMAAIIGLDDNAVIEACGRVRSGVVEAVNFNAPGQVVIAGEAAAVDQAMAAAKELGAKRALPLPVSVPSHCALMREAAEELGEELESISIDMPRVPVVHNQSASVAADVEEIRQRLKLQRYQPVQWVACVEAMRDQGVEGLVECGPGKVLTGLTRRIDKSLQAWAVFDAESLRSTQQAITEA